ncbi:reverse transcriptase family protein [Polaribacter undariae]|uniref:RNA-directed DNA polymerase n=2 Tax=Polaribacter sejongensis TaxID=985043 RepID=A0AAJ1QWJ3_9FLAO|nr:reverse transcriptase family protein [Polaribacter undariae]MDN3619387.1 reverse transcriptase family protein [Polaribacter undariae]UWD33413.1 reverse transcriptase family protein [Polaribacter undariae]
MSFSFKQFEIEARKQEKSQEFIDACLVYAKKLTENDYPVTFSLEHLAMQIGIQSDYLRNLIGDGKNDITYNYEHKYKRYNYFKLKKRHGGFREIMSPAKDLKFIQKWILVNILSKYKLADSCKGFRKGVSIFHNAYVHENSELILKVDLLKFYDTITEKRVYGVFKSLGYAKNLAYSLAKITTAKHRDTYWRNFDDDSKEKLKELVMAKPPILPQGAPTSPMLSNILATKMDYRFEALSKTQNCRYSRYADDMTFSITKDGKLPSLKLITKIISDEGFFINDKKTRYMKKGCKQYVTGLTTTNGTNVSKKYRKEISEHIYYCRKYGVSGHLEKREDFLGYNSLKFHNWLYGHLCFINSVNETASKKMLEDFNKIDWFV